MTRAALCAALLVLSTLPAAAGPVTLLSKADPGHPSGAAGGESFVAGISADGRYALVSSTADNLLAGASDTNVGNDLFLYDRIAGTTVLVSHAAGDPSAAGNAPAGSASLSSDGRWAAFTSTATNLVAGQTNTGPMGNIFLWDRMSGAILLVSHTPGSPTTTAGGCLLLESPKISADGGRVAFLSIAFNLVAGQSDAGNSTDAFLYDRATGANTLISHTSAGATAAAGGTVSNLALSADGSWAAYASSAVSIVAGQVEGNGGSDIFLYDSATGTNVLVSHAAGAAATTANSYSAALPNTLQVGISADGRRVAYSSRATNLMAGQVDGNSGEDIFLYDRVAGTNVLISHTAASTTTAGNSDSSDPVVSADGGSVAYMSYSFDLVGGANSPPGIFVYDRIAGTNVLASRRDASTAADSDSSTPRISSDGAWVAFLSRASNLVAGQADANGIQDVFLWSRASGTNALVSRTPASAVTAAGGDGFALQLSADGGWVGFSSTFVSLVNGSGDQNRLLDAFLYERTTATNRLLTARGGTVSTAAGGHLSGVTSTAMSNDGRSIAFTSDSSNLLGTTADGNQTTDVFLSDRLAGTAKLVSHANGSLTTTANAASRDPLVSADGSVVVFLSDASNVIQTSSQGPFRRQIYVYDRSTGTSSLVTHTVIAPSLPTGTENGDYSVSGDGRWIAFLSDGSNLVPGQVNNVSSGGIFLYDRTTGTNTLVSHALGHPTQTSNGGERITSISADGRYIAYFSTASDLTPGQTTAGGIFLYDRTTGTNAMVSPLGTTPPQISADGRWVLFVSGAGNVVPGQVDTNSTLDLFLWDRVSGSTQLVSRTPASPTTAGNGPSGFAGSFSSYNPPVPALSFDGRWVAFYSEATNLVNGQSGNPGGIFLFDRVAGTVTLVSHSAASPTDNRSSDQSAISADGRFVAFVSSGADLVPGEISPSLGLNHYLYDRIAGTTALVSHIPASEVTSGGLPASQSLEPPRISADGAWVAFASPSPDLAAGDHDGEADVFLYANTFPGRNFFTVTPCRLLDTRQGGQGPALSPGQRKIVQIHGLCGVPATAKAVTINVTITQPSTPGSVALHAGDMAADATSIVSFSPGQTRSSSAVLPLAINGTGTLAVTPTLGANGTAHLIVDVSGYFE